MLSLVERDDFDAGTPEELEFDVGRTEHVAG